MVSCQLARDWMKGTRLVRITWMMSVCVIRDSTNQPVWNNCAHRCGEPHQPRSGPPVQGDDYVAALEDEPHDGIGGVIEDRADRADKDNKLGISPMFHGRGLAICCGPTLSVGIGTWEKS